MQIIDPYIQVEKVDGKKIMRNIERACRTCYRSEGKITEESYKTLLKNCITRGHESVLEHEKITVSAGVKGCQLLLDRASLVNYTEAKLCDLIKE